jgi:hypothetical protein
MQIKILHSVGDDLKGAEIDVDDRRAFRLIRTGYAVEVKRIDEPPRLKKAKDDDGAKPSHRV